MMDETKRPEVKRCRVCSLRVVLYDPNDPESWVHDEDQEFADHTAEVTDG